MAPTTTTVTGPRQAPIPKSSAGITKRRAPRAAVIPPHRLATPPAETGGCLPAHLMDNLIRRFNPTDTQAIRNYFLNLPGFDFHPLTINGPFNLGHLRRLETMFRFPSGPRLFSEIPNFLAAEAAGIRLNECLHVLAVAATKYMTSYPRRHNTTEQEAKYYDSVTSAVNNHYKFSQDWQSSYGNHFTTDLTYFLVHLLISGRKQVDDIHPDEGDLGCAAEQLVDAWEQRTGRI